MLAGTRPANYTARVALANAVLAALLSAVAAGTASWWQAGSTWRNAVLIAAIGTLAVAATLALYRILRLAWWQAAAT